MFAAYLASRTLTLGTGFAEVYRYGGFPGIWGSPPQESIWAGRSWVVTFKHIFDSVIYAVLTAGTFGWLWPKPV
jgi:hypothetical protein